MGNSSQTKSDWSVSMGNSSQTNSEWSVSMGNLRLELRLACFYGEIKSDCNWRTKSFNKFLMANYSLLECMVDR
jgi:hypothetical protein